jgi:hypothetical protein
MTPSRETNPERLATAMEPYKGWTEGFEPYSWLADDRNVAVTDGEGSYNLMEYESDGVYWVHTFYTLKGRDAVRFVKAALSYALENTPVRVMKGLTPLEKLGARWLARQAGFVSHGVIKTWNGPMELFILTKDTE